MMEYPARPPHFDRLYLRLLVDCEAVRLVGTDGFFLLMLIAQWEDRLRYCRAVLTWNEELKSKLGNVSTDKLYRIRKRCVDAGFLHYEAGTKGTPGRYFVLVPPEYAEAFQASFLLTGKKESRRNVRRKADGIRPTFFT